VDLLEFNIQLIDIDLPHLPFGILEGQPVPF
jgi:hypothetical protein